jgi:hypothetical protein
MLDGEDDVDRTGRGRQRSDHRAPMNGPLRSTTIDATTTIAAVIAILSVSSNRNVSSVEKPTLMRQPRYE